MHKEKDKNLLREIISYADSVKQPEIDTAKVEAVPFRSIIAAILNTEKSKDDTRPDKA